METNNFKSQPCTTVEQSESLLRRGLKKETADCHYPMKDGKPCVDSPRFGSPMEQSYEAYPAWSLNRLLEMIPEDDRHYWSLNTMYFAFAVKGDSRYDFRGKSQSLYDKVLSCIDWLINDEYMIRDYLTEEYLADWVDYGKKRR